MEKDNILEELKSNILDIQPSLEEERITPQETLTNLGLNSIDQSELVMMTLENLDLRIPMPAFGGARNMDELADIIHKHSKT